MERFFNTPELLQNVFSHLTTRQMQRIVTVSRQWSSSALDVLWFEVDSLWRVIHVLAPVTYKYHYSFSRPLGPDDWARLDRYAGRVKHLKHTESCHRLDPGIFDQLARTRPRLDIFPNLRSIHWDFQPLDSLLFLHERVRTFTIVLPRDFGKIVPHFSPYLASRLPALEVLAVSLKASFDGLEEHLLSTIANLSTLKQVSLPTTPSKRLLEALSTLPALRKVTFEPFTTPDPQEVSFGDNAFPNLQDITLSITYHSTIKLLAQSGLTSDLTRIYLDSPVYETPADFTKLLTSIAASYPKLTSLGLLSAMSADPRPPSTELVDMGCLRPLLRLSTLRSLEVTHYYPLQLSQGDVEEIALALPCLENLILNCDPTPVSGGPSLTVAAMIPFAIHCPKLHRLGLYVHAPTTDILMSRPGTVFSNLRTLCLGCSTVADPRAVASFLSYLCPYVTTVATRDEWVLGVVLYSRVTSSRNLDQVANLLPLLTEVRAEERALARRALKQPST